MDKQLVDSVYTPTTEASRTRFGGSFRREYYETVASDVQEVREQFLAVSALMSFCTGKALDPTTTSLTDKFISTYERNLAGIAQNLVLTDAGDELTILWTDLSQTERAQTAARLLSDMQDMLHLTSDLKENPSISKTDISYLKAYHSADELIDLIASSEGSPLTVFDVTRIYMRNKSPHDMVQKVIDAYSDNAEVIDKFEFRELFLRRGIESLTDESIEAYIANRDVLVNDFKLPRQLAAIFELRYSSNGEPDKEKITALSTLIALVRSDLPGNQEDITEYFGSYARGGSIISELEGCSSTDITKLASKVTRRVITYIKIPRSKFQHAMPVHATQSRIRRHRAGRQTAVLSRIDPHQDEEIQV